jgi:TetR/AcrR family transcriptional regulator, transcriptional repressor for nem operon
VEREAERQDRDQTGARILDVAERLVQTRGFNGFSYADIAAELGITKASIHYHFASKAVLGRALIDRYATRFATELDAIDARLDDPAAKLDAYAALYAQVLRGDLMCLCGMLAAEFSTLPDPMRDAIVGFFDDSEVWLARVLDAGGADASLQVAAPSREAARLIVSGLEGAMLVARPYGDLARFEAAAAQLLASVARRPASPLHAPDTS